MEFGEFVRQLDAAIRKDAATAALDRHGDAAAAWTARARRAELTAVAPRNVSVTLDGGAAPSDTTWYPLDAALIPVVSRRIATFLGGA